MKISGNIPNLVKSNSDKIGAALGLFKDGIDPVLDSLSNIPAAHMPDWGLVLSDTLGDLKTPLTAVLVSMLVGDVSLPYVGKVGKALEKAAYAWIMGRVGLSVLYRSTHASGGSYDKNLNLKEMTQTAVGYSY